MESVELSSRMVDVLGIPLARLLAEAHNAYTIAFKKVLTEAIKTASKIRKENDIFRVFKCPKHNTWLQPKDKPFEHWSCLYWQGCEYKRAAKLRTIAERKIFDTLRNEYGE